MDLYKIIIEGYAKAGENGTFFASPTTTLIYSNNKKILVDPGANTKLLSNNLKKEKVSTEDIDIIFLTHYHPDHFLNLKLFPKQDVVDGTMIWRSDEEIEYSGNIPGTNIEVVPTPGHSSEHSSLMIEAEEGKVCIAQDVFWWEDGEQDVDNYDDLINKADPFASDIEQLKESRRKVLKLADWIIPGHGKKFKNNFKK